MTYYILHFATSCYSEGTYFFLGMSLASWVGLLSLNSTTEISIIHIRPLQSSQSCIFFTFCNHQTYKGELNIVVEWTALLLCIQGVLILILKPWGQASWSLSQIFQSLLPNAVIVPLVSHTHFFSIHHSQSSSHSTLYKLYIWKRVVK